MNDPYQKDGGEGGGGFGQWQNPQSPQMFNQMLGRGGSTPYQPQGLKQNRPGRNLFGPPQNGGINPGGMYGGAMPPPTDLPGPRFPSPGNTGPMPPPPGMQRPIDPRNAPITPPPPPNPDGWGMGMPEGGPPPIEDPHGQFPIGFPRPWLGQTGFRPQNPNMGWQGHGAFQPPVQQQPMGGPRNVWMGPRQPQAGGGPQGYGADPFQWRT